MYIKPKIYHSLDKASYNESSLQYLYCADVYYCNKYEIIVYTHIIQCTQCHNHNVLVVPHARRSL